MSAQPDPVDSDNSFDIASLTDDDLDELDEAPEAAGTPDQAPAMAEPGEDTVTFGGKS